MMAARAQFFRHALLGGSDKPTMGRPSMGSFHRDKILTPYALISSASASRVVASFLQAQNRRHYPIDRRTTDAEREEGLDGSSTTQVAQESG